MMNRRLKLERKMMGVTYYVPFAIAPFVIIFCYLFRNTVYQEYYMNSVFENTIPLFASWWATYSIYELLEEQGGEVIFTYGISKLKLGVINNLIYLSKYIILWTIVMSIIMQGILGKIYFTTIIQVVFQSLFFSSFSFLFMIICKNVGWSLFVQVTYFIISYFTKGEALYFFNIYLFQREFGNIQIILNNSFKCIIFSILFYAVGNKLVNRRY